MIKGDIPEYKSPEVKCVQRQSFFTKWITPGRGAFHVEVVGLVTAAALGSMGEVFIGVPVGLVFGLALIVRRVGAGDVQLRFGGRGISCGRQWRRFVVVRCSFQFWSIWSNGRQTATTLRKQLRWLNVCYMNRTCWPTLRALAKARGGSGETLSLGHVSIAFWTVGLLSFSRGVRVFSSIWTTPRHVSLSGGGELNESHPTLIQTLKYENRMRKMRRVILGLDSDSEISDAEDQDYVLHRIKLKLGCLGIQRF